MIAAIETAILARLQAAADANVLGYAWKSLDTYPENWDQHLKAKRPERYPAAWVVFAGWGDATESDAGNLHVTMSFGLVVAARNLRNETSTRHGKGPAEPGSYQLLLDAAALLSGETLGLDIDRIRIAQCRSVRPTETMQSLSLSAFALELSIGVTIGPAVLPADDAALADFESFHVDWDVSPFVPITTIPDDAAADAVDHILLETAP